jgi:signal transduction histidine kinase
LLRVGLCSVASVADRVREVTRTGAAQILGEVPPLEPPRSPEETPALQALRTLEIQSGMLAPLVAHGRAMGAIFLGSAESGRRFRPDDLALAQELALRAALSLENRSLFHAAQRAVQLRDSVLAVVSHDLRNLLSAVTLNADALQRAVSRPEIDRIRRASHGMKRLIADLLDVASIQAGQLSLERRPVADVTTLIRDVIGLFEPAARMKALEIDLEAAPGLPLFCDKDRLVQVLTNLIGNAVKFCRERDRIAVRVHPSPGELWFEISDSGPGIAHAELRRIFDAYFTGSRPGHGTGLGLTIAKGIVEAHGGRIWAEGDLGLGLTMRFTLPQPDRRPS